MNDMKERNTSLPPEDQEFLDDFRHQWNDSLDQMRPLVDTSTEAIDDLCHQTMRHHRQNVVRRTALSLSIAASMVVLVTVGTIRWINHQPDFEEGPQYAQLTEEHISHLTPPASPVAQPTQPAPQVHHPHATPTPLNSQLSTLNVPARQRPCGANSQLPESAPQDISAPLSNIEDTYTETAPVYCNHECDNLMIACAFEKYYQITGGQLS